MSNSENQTRRIKISGFLWKQFLKNDVLTIETSKRRKFRTNFDDFISIELQKTGTLCWLRHKHNWFNTKKEFWHGVFRCIDKNCPLIYKCKIENNNLLGVNLDVCWKELNVTHVKLSKKNRCSGLSRKEISYKLIANGTSNTRQDHILHNLLTDGKIDI
jgi:hypothetical protein